MEIPEFRFTRSGDVAIAYQLLGGGEQDLVFVPFLANVVSSTVKDLVAGSGLALAERREHELKVVPGTWRLYAVSNG